MKMHDIDSSLPFLELVNQNPSAILLVDEQLSIRFANTAAEHTFHTEASELKKLTLSSLNQSSETLEYINQIAEQVFKASQAFESKLALMSGAGLRYYQCSIQPLSPYISICFQDISAQVDAETSLKSQSTHDPLTGLFNRQQLFVMGTHDIARSKRYGYAISLLVISVDNIRQINQTYGYNIGDFVLINIAKVLQGMLRESDYVARLDNKSFVISLLDANSEQTQVIAERIHKLITEKDIIVADAHIPVQIAIGKAQFNDSQDHHFDDLLLRAENNCAGSSR